ncbi:hypothetical protein HK102_006271 [Quaeritorhiza haematococci]|nr:hypothetical protein HK102_006271 [Quaeritorhiza haematococci]
MLRHEMTAAVYSVAYSHRLGLEERFLPQMYDDDDTGETAIQESYTPGGGLGFQGTCSQQRDMMMYRLAQLAEIKNGLAVINIKIRSFFESPSSPAGFFKFSFPIGYLSGDFVNPKYYYQNPKFNVHFFPRFTQLLSEDPLFQNMMSSLVPEKEQNVFKSFNEVVTRVDFVNDKTRIAEISDFRNAFEAAMDTISKELAKTCTLPR